MRPTIRRQALAGLAGIALLGVGLVTGAVWTEHRLAARFTASDAGNASPRPGSAPTAASDEPLEVSLTPEAIQRASIKTTIVRTAVSSTSTTVPGTVTSNAYRDLKVNTLVGGVIRQVRPELGATVRPGEPLAVIFSNELAEAQMRYLSMRAMLEADHAKLDRTQTLFDMGAVARQELEGVVATHAGHASEVAASRQRLLLYGLTPEQVGELRDSSQVVSEVAVHAPLGGIVVSRSINPGQVVAAGQELFIVTDLSTVWVIGDLYEKDFPSVRVGTAATIVAPTTGRSHTGRGAYLDPRVDPSTRTAKVRVEVPNDTGALRLGMFVNVGLETAGADQRVLAPRSAVQSIGERQVVYVAAGDGRFIERTVKIGTAVGDHVEVLDGLKAGERVVNEGSFFLRAEAARNRAGS
jgi:cobalt-zinc-cadmium efflux system membrane fusion protein